MKMDKIANSGNDEFYTPVYAVEPILKYIPKGKSVWCPFDMSSSLIVKTLQKNGFDVYYTHIDTGSDFFKTSPKGDIIVSNPPYSIKGDVFKRLFDLNLPFCMLVGVVGLFESQKRFEMFRDNNFEIMYLSRRVSYFKNFDDQKPALNPPFSSVWITKDILPSRIVFEEIIKK